MFLNMENQKYMLQHIKKWINNHKQLIKLLKGNNYCYNSYKWTNVKSYLDIMNRDSKFC